MKAAFVSVVPSPYQRDLFRALAQRPEVDLSVYYLEASAPDSPWPQKALEPYEKILRGFWFSIGSARCHVNWPLPALQEFDVVVMNTLMSFTAQWLMRTALRSKRWFFWGERLGRGGKMHERLAAPLHRAAGIAAIGTFADEDYQARFPEPHHFRIPYFCDLDPFFAVPRRTRNDGHIVFLFCGQMIARKGVDLLLEAFQRLGTAARLLLVGREAELPALLAPLPAHLRERITYAGFQAPEELPRFFGQADVFVLPSRYDGWGVVVNQALGAGLPIICSDMVGAGRDLVEEEINGFRFPMGHAATLAEKMQRFVVQPALCDRLGQASRRRARNWTPAAGAAKWVEAFQAVIQT
ncbi:MAG: glycosyltransferase family 4 protein [Chthoniobacter sp.]|uniref:glycosyltransferase family 4 protein n=1 Tax=Chthoniobacter sp. TaxID=2510640 RepID=UPI0032A8B4F4